MSNKYTEMKNRHQAETNALPMKFAFSREQIDKMIEEFGVPTSEIRHLGMGTYAKASDVSLITETFKKHEDELTELMKNSEFAYDMFRYELANHEYGYTGDVEDTLTALGLSYKGVKGDKVLNKALERACKDTR